FFDLRDLHSFPTRRSSDLGSSGVHCEKSYMSMNTGIIELRASYHVYLPLPVFGNVVVPMEESCRVKGWTGYERAGFLAEDEETRSEEHTSELQSRFDLVCR